MITLETEPKSVWSWTPAHAEHPVQNLAQTKCNELLSVHQMNNLLWEKHWHSFLLKISLVYIHNPVHFTSLLAHVTTVGHQHTNTFHILHKFTFQLIIKIMKRQYKKRNGYYIYIVIKVTIGKTWRTKPKHKNKIKVKWQKKVEKIFKNKTQYIYCRYIYICNGHKKKYLDTFATLHKCMNFIA